MVFRLVPTAFLVSIAAGYNIPTKSCTLEGNLAYISPSATTLPYPVPTGNGGSSLSQQASPTGSHAFSGSLTYAGGQFPNNGPAPSGSLVSSINPTPSGGTGSNNAPGSSGNTNPGNFGNPWWWNEFPPNGPFAAPWWYDPEFFDPTWFWPWLNDGNGDGDALGTSTTSSTTTMSMTTTTTSIAGCPAIPTCTNTVTQSNTVITTTQTLASSTVVTTGITTTFVTANPATTTVSSTGSSSTISSNGVTGTTTTTTTTTTTISAALTCLSSAGIYTAPQATTTQVFGRRDSYSNRFVGIYEIQKRNFDGQRRQANAVSCPCATVSQMGSTFTTTVTTSAIVETVAQSTVTSTVTPSLVTVTATGVTSTTSVGSSMVATATVTSTVTQTINTAATPTSNGLKWYWYANNYSYNSGIPTIDFSQYAGNSGYVRTGVLQKWGYDSGDFINGYLDGYPSEYEIEHETIVAHGYLYAQTAGNYTITTAGDNIDDQIFIFSRQNALGAPPAFQNPDITTRLTNAQSVTYILQAGEAMAIAIISINGDGPKNSVFNVILPDGTNTQETTGLFVQHCDTSEFVGPSGVAFGTLPAAVPEEN